MLTPKEIAYEVTKALDAKKGQNIKLLKIDRVSSLADYFLICTGTSNTHVKTLCDYAEYTLEQLGEQMLSREGHRGNSWELLDYGSIVVHVFTEEARKFYDLERLWADAELVDIRDINESNVRVKEVMEQQLIDHKDSIGKIYSITAGLEQRMPDEVIFYAVEMLGKLMKTKDVALYNVVSKDYARIFSASSQKARSLGNSIRYREMTDIYDALKEQKVYINKKMDEQYPLMARGIYEGEEVQMIVMMWGLSWEKMTLGQANFLTVVSYLIQNAVLRAQRYMQALEEKRYSQNSRILEPEAFESLVQAYMKAKLKNLVECVLIKVDVQNSEYQKTDEQMSGYMRDSDYMGMLPDGNLYVLLTNTTREGAVIVQDRFEKNGYKTEYVEMMSVCHRE